MKLLRYGPPGNELPGLLDKQGQIRSLVGIVDDIAGETLSDAALSKLRGLDLAKLPVVDTSTRIGPCVGRVGKFIGIGLNYAEHAAEAGAQIPTEPIVFMKATSTISSAPTIAWKFRAAPQRPIGK